MTDLSKLSNADLWAMMNPATSPRPAPLPVQAPRDSAAFDPANWTNSQLSAYLADTDPRMSTIEDVGRSALGGGQRAVSGIAAAPRGVADTAQSLAQAGADFLGRHGLAPEGLKVPAVGHVPGPVEVPSLPELIMALTGAGVTAANQHLPHWARADPAAVQAGVAMTNPGLALAGPSPEHLAVATNGGIPIHQPQTGAGRYAMRVAEMAPMALQPGGIVQRAANVVVPGVASQAAEDVAPEGYKPGAALVAALLGSGAVNGIAALNRAPEASFGRALGDISEDDVTRAEALRIQAKSRGIDLTLPEAVQQVTNNATGLGSLQRVVENTPEGRARMAPYFADRPNQIAQAVRGYADTIAAPTDEPSMIGVRAQDAAGRVLTRVRQTVNTVAEPSYAAIEGQTMPPEEYAQLAADPSYKMALENLRSHPELGPQIAHLPDNNLAVVNAVEKRLGFMADQAAGTPLAPGDNQLAGVRTGSKALADELARQASEKAGAGEYGDARDTVRDLSGRFLDPLKAGPVGTISATQVVPEQTAALYPKAPLEGASAETAKAVRLMEGATPGVSSDLTRQHLVNALDTSLRDLQGGQNQYAGAKYSVGVSGSPEQAATLRAGVSALPEGAARAADLDSLLEALRATGKRQVPGSLTAFNAQALKDLQIAVPAKAIGRLGNPLEWGHAVGDMINEANYRRNVSRLADAMLAEPESTADTLAKVQAAAARSRGAGVLPAVIVAGASRKQK